MTDKQMELLLQTAKLLISQYPAGDNYPAAWDVECLRYATEQAEIEFRALSSAREGGEP